MAPETRLVWGDVEPDKRFEERRFMEELEVRIGD
jgi:hypothetical protein